MRTNRRMKCSGCGHWDKVTVNKIFIEEANPVEPKVKVLIPMYEPCMHAKLAILFVRAYSYFRFIKYKY